MEGSILMQRFTLLHDGSAQGWRTAYLALHVAARLGAPLQVLVLDTVEDKETVAQRARQITIGGRAAGMTIETCIVPDFSPESLISNIDVANGLFIPSHLLPDQQAAASLFAALSCPLWIVSEESETRKMAVLIEDLTDDGELISYAATLSQRMSQPLTGLVTGEGLPQSTWNGVDMDWMTLRDFSLPVMNSALHRLNADLLFLQLSRFSMIGGLNCTCVIYPSSGHT
jgi:hypothetical protein